MQWRGISGMLYPNHDTPPEYNRLAGPFPSYPSPGATGYILPRSVEQQHVATTRNVGTQDTNEAQMQSGPSFGQGWDDSYPNNNRVLTGQGKGMLQADSFQGCCAPNAQDRTMVAAVPPTSWQSKGSANFNPASSDITEPWSDLVDFADCSSATLHDFWLDLQRPPSCPPGLLSPHQLSI
jgi:hypothetical protein